MSRAAVIVTVGAVALVASLWLPRVEAESFEDFYDTYEGRLGLPADVPDDVELAALPTAVAIVLWVLGAVVLFPGLDAPPFERLAGTWVAAAATAAATATTAAGLAVVARQDQQPQVVGRQPYRNISIANSDSAAFAYTHSAINEGYRAVNDLPG